MTRRRIFIVGVVVLVALWAALFFTLRAAAGQVSGCEHSSNFRAPAGCPDDGSGREPDTTAAPGSTPPASPVSGSPRFVG